MTTQRDDEGLTLVELLIYIFISTLFLSLLAALFISGLNAQAKATNRDSATGDAGAVSGSIASSVRNSSAFSVKDSGKSLIAKVATGSIGWECRAWAVADGELRYASSHSPISTANTSGWAVLAENASTSLTGDAAFKDIGSRSLSIGLRFDVGETTIPVTNGVTAQAVSNGTDTTTCW